jgi:hypothetical protein
MAQGWRSHGAALGLLPGLWACSSKFSVLEAMDTAGGSEATLEDSSGADSGGSDEELSGAAWWKLGATLDIRADEAGGVQPELLTSLISASLLDSQGALLCSGIAPIGQVMEIAPTPDPLIITWWWMERGEWSTDCTLPELEEEMADLPHQVLLGVGDMHPEIAGALGAVEGLQPGAAATLNGAYASLEDEVIYVFGVAGTEEAMEGAEGPAVGSPLKAGRWLITPVYSFPLGG